MHDVATITLMIGLVKIVAPFVTALSCFFVWRKQLTRPGVFVGVSVLAMFGLRGVLEVLARALRLLGSFYAPRVFLPSTNGGAVGILHLELGQALLVALLTIVLGIGILRSLTNALAPASVSAGCRQLNSIARNG